MAFLASLFWDPEDVLVQYRPAAADYINNHPHCLHWWRPTHVSLPQPKSILVGVNSLNVLYLSKVLP